MESKNKVWGFMVFWSRLRGEVGQWLFMGITFGKWIAEVIYGGGGNIFLRLSLFTF
jgi:hypothetical protein